ncbi:glycosyltransferase family 2 protein [Bradyrhizobium manausense]|uniref:glycosyltransferase family 2 protein n=1 Tax=Bradyrhizobium manausense TaxID=989370 RepID=UPI001BAD37F8|nr:glycosyltransferase family 2 protein [Bradyrhizobium manausense]MBR0685647.1 glycosyltransferase family 2 protein [Bradyrhizobium manausense]
MTPPDVVVAIVTYKSADLTVACIRSIEVERAASKLAISVVVVDNVSGDAPAIAQSIADNHWGSWVRLVVAPKNGGFAYGNNVAIREAAQMGPPRYCHLLNPDTELRSGAIDTLVSFLDQNRSVGIAGSSFENLDGSDWPIAFLFPTLLSEVEAGFQTGLVSRILSRWVVARQMSKNAERIDWVPGASMMVRWTVVEKIGGLDENYFLYFEETDFCHRSSQAGFQTWYVPASRVMHIAGQSTKVTERDAKVKRLPAYWFESRRRFFATTYGLRYAMATDLAALAAHGLGLLKRLLLGRGHEAVPHFMRDLWTYSVLRPANRPAAVKDSVGLDGGVRKVRASNG